MHEEVRLLLGKLFEKPARPYLVALQPFVLPHRPSHQRLVEVPEDGVHRRPIESSVIREPTPQDWIVQSGNVG